MSSRKFDAPAIHTSAWISQTWILLLRSTSLINSTKLLIYANPLWVILFMLVPLANLDAKTVHLAQSPHSQCTSALILELETMNEISSSKFRAKEPPVPPSRGGGRFKG